MTLKPGRYIKDIEEKKILRPSTGHIDSLPHVIYSATRTDLASIPPSVRDPDPPCMQSGKVKAGRKFQAQRALQQHPIDSNKDGKNTLMQHEMLVEASTWLSSLGGEGASHLLTLSLVNDRNSRAQERTSPIKNGSRTQIRSHRYRDDAKRAFAHADLERLGISDTTKRRKSTSPFASSASVTGSEGGSLSESDTEEKPFNMARGGKRNRRVSSRTSSPAPPTFSDDAKTRSAILVPPLLANAPVRPSPLSANTILADES